MTNKAKEIARFLYDETVRCAPSLSYYIPFARINMQFGIDVNDEKLLFDIAEELGTNYVDMVSNIDIDNVSQVILILLYEKPVPQTKTIDLPICYVHMIEDCIKVVKKHDLLNLAYGDVNDVDAISIMSDLQEILDNFCIPLDEIDKDVKIIID